MVKTLKTHDLRAGQAKQGDSSKGTLQRNPQICKGTARAGQGCGAPGIARGGRARVTAAVNSWLLCTRSVRARDDTGVGTGSPGRVRKAGGRRRRAQVASEAGGVAGKAWRRGRGGACSFFCSTTRRRCAGRALRAACAGAACVLFVVGRKLRARPMWRCEPDAPSPGATRRRAGRRGCLVVRLARGPRAVGLLLPRRPSMIG